MMPSKKNKKYRWFAFNAISILDLFMLATFVFAMNADVADKKYQRQYKDQLSAATNETARLTGRLTDVSNKLEKAENQLGSATNETARLTGRLADVTNKLEKARFQLDAATNETARLTGQMSNMSNKLEKSENQLGAATNEVARLTGRLTDVTNKLEKSENQLGAATNEVAQLTERLTDVTDKLEKAETQLGVATNEVARLTGGLTDVTDKLEKTKNQLGVATNKNAELNEKFSKLKTEFDNLKDSHAKLDKLFQDYSAMLPTNETPIVYASVCCLGNKRVFWKNNQEWSCCSGESGDQIEDFLKTKSIREEVKVHINFIRFYDCAERENGIVALLQGKYQKENVSESSASGCHLIDMRDANNIYLDWEKTPVTLDKLEKELGLIAEGESDEKGIKYFMACPKSNNEEDRIRGWLNNAYGHPVEFEVMYY